MKISPAQIACFEGMATAAFRDRMRPHVTEYFPTVADAVGPDGLAAIIDAAIARARAHGFHGRAGVRSYLDLSLLLGAQFDDDPLLPFVPPHLDWDRARAALRQARDGDPDWPQGVVADDDDPDPIDMLQGLYEDAWAWLDLAAGEDFVHLYKALARLRALLDGMPGDDADRGALCARMFPEKAALSPPPLMDAFLTAAMTRAEADGIPPGPGRTAYVLHCFVGGIGAFHDPAFSLGGRVAADIAATGPTRTDAYLAFMRAYIDRILASARAHGREDI